MTWKSNSQGCGPLHITTEHSSTTIRQELYMMQQNSSQLTANLPGYKVEMYWPQFHYTAICSHFNIVSGPNLAIPLYLKQQCLLSNYQASSLPCLWFPSLLALGIPAWSDATPLAAPQSMVMTAVQLKLSPILALDFPEFTIPPQNWKDFPS